jgi:3-hydroxyisobutyrate dehydrogenase
MTDGRMKVALLGLGIMGDGMARRLAASDAFEVAVWNRTRAKAEALVPLGARAAETPADAARGAEIVLAMLADDGASRAAWLGEEGALGGMSPGSLAIECSTLTIGWVRELAASAGEARIGFLDAPVSGTKPQAAAGALRFLVGGEATTIARAQPVFDVLGQEVVRLGPTGSGCLFKLINNFLCGVQVATLAEAMAMLERSGLDPTTATAALVAGAPGSPIVKMLAGRMLERDYTPNFVPGLMAKDLTYAMEAFAASGIELRTAAAARQRFQDAAADHPHADMATVVEPLRSSPKT